MKYLLNENIAVFQVGSFMTRTKWFWTNSTQVNYNKGGMWRLYESTSNTVMTDELRHWRRAATSCGGPMKSPMKRSAWREIHFMRVYHYPTGVQTLCSGLNMLFLHHLSVWGRLDFWLHLLLLFTTYRIDFMFYQIRWPQTFKLYRVRFYLIWINLKQC